LVNYLQDCSTFQSEELGVGLEFMRERHFAWFISAWQIVIDRLPRFCEPITVSTWAYGVRRVDAQRNFTIADAEGNLLVRADSHWFVFDTELRRPVRIPPSEAVYRQGDAALDLPPTPRKIALSGEFVEAAPVTIEKTHLDTNGHVNNAQYVRMALGALDESVDVARLLVAYRRMALLGDVVVPRVHTEADGVLTIDLADPDGDTFAVVQLYPRTTSTTKENADE
jgi:acyl-ACP thioesterase